MTAFELAIQDATGVAIATRIRPDRTEVCAALGTGGLTPSPALTEAAAATGVPAHVLIRPREGGFVYDTDEQSLILADVRLAFRLGAAGVVIGALEPDGALNTNLVRRIIDAAEGREVTFHRAFDQVDDRLGTLDTLDALGITRVLTSGGAARAADALDELRTLVAQGTSVQIMAGGGVTSTNAATIAATGVAALHASAKRRVHDALHVSLGVDAPAGETGYATTDENEARLIQDVLAR